MTDNKYATPEWFVPGLQPRVSQPGVRFPLFGEKIGVIDPEDWPKYTGQVSVKHFVKTILNQGPIGSCASESSTQALMITRAMAGEEHVILNPYFVYGRVNGGSDRGSSIDTNMEFLLEKGCAPEAVWPRSRGWKQEPSNEAYQVAQQFRYAEVFDITTIVEKVSALLKGFAVVWGARYHAITSVEHLNNREPLIVNSWGTNWGDDGFGVWAPYSGVDFRYGAFAVRCAVR